MILVLNILFWIFFTMLLHSYMLYPLFLRVFANNKKLQTSKFSINDNLPSVAILLAAYNEDSVIEEKILTTFETDYPLDKITFFIGSDASTDRTETIINGFQEKYPNLKLVNFEGRSGKPKIINQLQKEANAEVLVITDANVMFNRQTIFNLVKHFKTKDIGLVGGNILNFRVKKDGISVQEKTYLKSENIIKYREGVLWGAMIGTFGGVYAIRNSLYEEVPPNYTVDDFYISMVVLERGFKAINDLDAIAYEDVSHKPSEEFRRKTRISMGNYQNLKRFKKILWPIYKGKAFAFYSHKVLRWFGPILIILMLLSSGILAFENLFYVILFLGQLSLIFVPIIDRVLSKLNVHISVIRFISHFFMMNIALFVGMIRFLFGIKSNVWKPTERRQVK